MENNINTMNIAGLLSLIALAVSFVSSTHEDPSAVCDRLLDILGRHALSNTIRNRGAPDNDSPAARDTINFETQKVDFCGPILCISANLTNGSLTGVTGYDVLKLEFNTNGARVVVDIDMIFPTLRLDAEYYEMEGSIMEAFPLAGEGKLHFETTDLRFWTKIVLQISDLTYIESFKNSGFSVKSISSHTDFDGNIDDIFNAMVEELLADRLNRFNKAIAARLGELLKDTINPFLN